MKRHRSNDNLELPFTFGTNFLKDYAGQIINDSRVAIVELVANSYDAGATRVEIKWPSESGKPFSITDNGLGMTREEFLYRWRKLAYSRADEQGFSVEFPANVKNLTRTAFGRNGKGRLAPFCFSDSYTVESTKDGNCIEAEVTLSDDGAVPFYCEIKSEKAQLGHGTVIRGRTDRSAVSPEWVSELIGSKFSVDPDFAIRVNGELVTLYSLEGVWRQELTIPDIGKVTVHRIDSHGQDRTMKLRGITWWVNRRMVGEPSWEGLDGVGRYLDGRTSEAKRFSFVVEADLLKENTLADWTGFVETEKSQAVKTAVHEFVENAFVDLFSGQRKEEKKRALERSRGLLRSLPATSRASIGHFIDEVLAKCPKLSHRDLSLTVEVYAKLEQTKSGYDLLQQLASCSPDDLDTWNGLMQSWTATNAEIVLNEIEKRITLIRKLQELVRSKSADELHDLQPLFERGLWIFGPEYEGIEFRANRTMVEIVHKFFKKSGVAVTRKRPDIVALPDSSIGLYSSNSYSQDGEVDGVSKVLIVELKRGGFRLAQRELDQARDYGVELQTTGAVQQMTRVECWVLGAELAPGLQQNKIGETLTVRPTVYDTILARAHARIFNLQRRIEESLREKIADPEIEEILSTKTIEDISDEAREQEQALSNARP
jgi:histidine kinase/DNA gyrase B/HSP90-like ATPase